MGARLPLLAGYLERLPGGIDAYPECVVKGSMVRNAMADKPLGPEIDLPAPLRALVDHPPPVTDWVPEVHFNGLMLAIRDAYFDGAEKPFVDWVYDQNQKLMSTPLYKVLFFVMSPERLLIGLEKRWGSFRRGTEPKAIRHAAHDVEIVVRTPPNLHTRESVQGMAAALRATITCAGAKEVRVDGVVRTPTEISYRLRWA
jgi:hypothetical protein